MRRLGVPVALALLALAAALAPATAAQPGGDGERATLTGERDVLYGTFFPGPGMGHHAVVLQGRPTEVWLYLYADEAPVSDTVRLTAEGGDLNRSTIQVALGADERAAYPLLVTNATGGAVYITATFDALEGADGAPVRVARDVPVTPPVSVRLTRPVARGEMLPATFGWPDAAEFAARVSNPLAHEAVGPLNLSLVARDPRGGAVQVGAVEVPRLAPGASRDVTVATVRASEVADDSLAALLRSRSGVSFALHVAAPGGAPVQALAFQVEGPRFTSLEPAQVEARFIHGVQAYVEDMAARLGQPSWVRVAVANHGDGGEEPVRVDVRVRPDPPVHYGPATHVRETRFVTVAPGAVERFNVTFTPRVDAAHSVDVDAYFDNFHQGRGIILDVDGPGGVRVVDRASSVRLHPGETVRARVVFTAVEGLRDARVGVAATTEDLAALDGAGVAFARYVTTGDLLGVDAAPGRVTAAANGTVWLNLTLTAEAAGRFVVVPFVEAGGVYFPLGAFRAYVLAGPFSVVTLWLPAALAAAGFGGFHAYRRRWVG